eukprot:gene7051-7117_t
MVQIDFADQTICKVGFTLYINFNRTFKSRRIGNNKFCCFHNGLQPQSYCSAIQLEQRFADPRKLYQHNIIQKYRRILAYRVLRQS